MGHIIFLLASASFEILFNRSCAFWGLILFCLGFWFFVFQGDFCFDFCKDTSQVWHMQWAKPRILFSLHKSSVPSPWLALFHQHDSTHVNRQFNGWFQFFFFEQKATCKNRALLSQRTKFWALIILESAFCIFC